MPPKYAKKKGFKKRFRRFSRIKKGVSTTQKSGMHMFKRTVNASDEYAVGNLALSNGTMSNLTATGGYLVLTTPAAVTNTFSTFGYQFSLAGLPGLSDFTSLFDSYQIAKVVIRFIPMSNCAATTVAGAPNGNPSVSGFVHYVHDADDSTQPAASETGINDLRQYPSYRMRRVVGEKGWTIALRPKIATTVYRSGVSSGYAQGKGNQWLDLVSTDIPHYGVKGVFELVNPNAQSSVVWIRTETTYYLKFKGVR